MRGERVYIPAEQIKAVHERGDSGTAVIVEGVDDESPWMVVETAGEIARLRTAWTWRDSLTSDEIRDGAKITALGLHPTTKRLIAEYAHLHLEQVH